MNREEGEKIYGECYLCGHHGEIEDVCRVDGTHIVGPKRGCPWPCYPWTAPLDDAEHGK